MVCRPAAGVQLWTNCYSERAAMRSPLLLLALCAVSLAETRLVPWELRFADYSKPLDRVIVPSPSGVQLLDPQTGTGPVVDAGRPVTAFSMSPDGRFAALGHDRLITYVNLTTARVERTYSTDWYVAALLLRSDVMYVAGPALVSVSLATGQQTPTTVNPYFVSNPVVSLDGTRAYAVDQACQNQILAADPAFHGSRVPGICQRAVFESASTLLLANTDYVQAEAGNRVIITDGHTRQQVARFQLTEVTVNNTRLRGQIDQMWFRSDGSELYVAGSASVASGARGHFLERYVLAGAACPISLNTTALSVPASAGLRSVTVTSAASDCVYRAASNAPWVRAVTNGTGSGGGNEIGLRIEANRGTAARTAAVTVGNQTLTITQAAAPLSTHSVPFVLTEAAYSKALDRVLLLDSDPPALLLFDPLTGGSDAVVLAYAPQSVAVTPDGLTAVVGHWHGALSVVNLQMRTVERVVPIRSGAAALAATGNGYAYVLGDQLYSVPLGGGVIESTPAVDVRTLRHRPGTNYLFGATHPYRSLQIWDIRVAAVPLSPSSVSADNGSLFFAEDGQTLFANTGIYAAQAAPSPDFRYVSAFAPPSLGNTTTWVAHSQARRQAARLVADHVQTYDDGVREPRGLVRLTRPESAPDAAPVGKFAFWNKNNDAVVVVAESVAAPGIPAHTVVQRLPVAALDCPLTATPLPASFPAAGGTGTLKLTTPANCMWIAFRLEGNSSFVSGDGSRELPFTVPVNPGLAPRTIEFSVNDRPVTVSQAAPTDPAATLHPTQFLHIGGSATLQITASPNQAWSIVSASPWVVITGSLTGTGSQTRTIAVLANNSSAARTATLSIGDLVFTLRQVGNPTSTPGASLFTPVSPCRIVDTRLASGPFGSPFVAGGTERRFPILQGWCGIPALPLGEIPTAYSVNVTVVPRRPLAYLTIWPDGQPRPVVSTLNSFDGRIKAASAIVPAGSDGAIRVYATDDTDVILDLNGYFGGSGLPYQPLTPCRVVDTRVAGATNGAPSMSAGATRVFHIAPGSGIGGACENFASVASLAVNITAIPKSGGLGYLTVWSASGLPQPVASTLNSPTGAVVANLALIPSSNFVSVFATDPVDLVIDLMGVFPGEFITGPTLRFYPVTPCRLADTRNAAGWLGGPSLAAGQSRDFPVTGQCGIPATARAVSVNATVVPRGLLSYLALRPGGVTQSNVSTLNAFDAAVTSNASIMPLGTNGAINALVTDATDLILDVNGYFAP